MRTINILFFLLTLLAILFFAVYVSMGQTTCEKIERGSEPAIWPAWAAEKAAAPWVSEERLKMIQKSGFTMQLKFANFLQGYNNHVVCPWDMVGRK